MLNRRMLQSAVIALLTGWGPAGVGAAGPSFGDGIGTIQEYDRDRRVVVVDNQRVSLTADAATSLDGQLADLGWTGRGGFGAKFQVRGDAAGDPVISSVHVFRPKKK